MLCLWPLTKSPSSILSLKHLSHWLAFWRQKGYGAKLGGTGEGNGEHLWWWSWWVRALMVGVKVGEKGEGGERNSPWFCATWLGRRRVWPGQLLYYLKRLKGFWAKWWAWVVLLDQNMLGWVWFVLGLAIKRVRLVKWLTRTIFANLAKLRDWKCKLPKVLISVIFFTCQ